MIIDQKKLREMSGAIARISKYSKNSKTTPYPTRSFTSLREVKEKVFIGKTGAPGTPGKDGVSETPETIALKLNTLKEAIEGSVIKGFKTPEEIFDFILKELKTGKKRLAAKDITDLPQPGTGYKMSDQRWHGSGSGHVIQDEGTALTQQPNLNFIGSGVTATNNSLTNATDITITTAGGGTWYQDEVVATSSTASVVNLLHTPTNIVFLYLNGQYLTSGIGRDYTRSGTTITLTTALIASDVLTANYL